MRSAIIGFVVGVGCLQMQGTLPQYPLILLLLAGVILLALLLRRVEQQWHRILLLAGIGVMLGFAWAAGFAHHYLAEQLPAQLEGQDVTVTGVIDSLPDHIERGVRFNFKVEKVLPLDGVIPIVPSRLALSWYAERDADTAVPEIRPGERWQLTVRLHRPHGNANPYGFDYEVWLLEQKIRATGYVRSDRDATIKNARLNAFVPGLDNAAQRSRAWLRARVQHSLQGKPYAGVIAALVVGDQRAVSQSDWTVFNRTGVSHLISISGLHITMVAALFAWLIFALWRRSFFTRAQLPLWLPAQKAAAVAGVAAALVYVLLAGAGVPAQRTLCMLSVVALALWCGRLASVSHVLCIALGTVVVLDPWAVLMPGFWLSFAAVATILYVSTGRAVTDSPETDTRIAHWRAALATATRTQYAITLGLAPLTVLLFAQMSLVSPLANAIAIPLVSFAVTPAALLGSVLPAPLSGWLLNLAHFAIAELAQFLNWLSTFSFAVWVAPMPAWWMFALALLGALWMLAPRGWPARYMGAFLWLPLILNVPTHPKAGEMWVTAFDVGQGMALLVETQHHRLLYDTGPFYSPDSDGGTRIILPYLKGRGIDALDAMVVTHSDMDHSGGALSILQQVRVGWMSSSLPLDHAVVAAAPTHRRCAAGQTWQWDGVNFDMLHPAMDSYNNEKLKPNARSCTLKITVGGHSILLAGDIEAPQEMQLLAHDARQLRADILLAPHHGSGTSSTLPFLQAVHPQIAIFQVGYRNRYRHPKPEIFARYGELGIVRLRSDVSGAVLLHLAPAITSGEYRVEHARYWYGR